MSETLTIAQAASGNFFANSGGQINRVNDRVLIGAATVADANYPSAIKDYVESQSSNSTSLAQLASLSTIGGLGVVGGSRTSDNTTPGSESAIGVAGYMLNDNSLIQQTGYGLYGEAHHWQTAHPSSITQGLEVDTANHKPTTVAVNPYAPYEDGATYGAFISSGAGLKDVYDISLGVLVGNNGAASQIGLMFDANGITGTDGVTGAGTAIGMAKGHVIRWFGPGGVPGSAILSQGTNGDLAMIQTFGDDGLSLSNATSGQIAHFSSYVPYTGQTSLALLVGTTEGPRLVPVSLSAPINGVQYLQVAA